MSRFDSFLKASLDSSFVKRRGVLVRSSSPRAFEFACHSAACAPPPAGKGGSTPGGDAVAQAVRRGFVPLTQREAAPFVKAGLLVRGDGKGRGMGNTPVWEPTVEARRRHNASEDTRKIKFANQVHKVVSEDETHFRVMKPSGETFRIPKSIAKFVND